MNRLANLLGAAAVAVTDAQVAAMAAATGHSPSAAAALLTLGQTRQAPPTLSQMAAIVGISHSAMVRLIDGLARAGLVARQTRRDGREVAVALTDSGTAAYDSLHAARARVLADLARDLPEGSAEALRIALTQILTSLTQDRRAADHICRFCDEAACGGDVCPVETRAISVSRP